MNRAIWYMLVVVIIINWHQKSSAQIVLLGSFNPSKTGSLCGIGFDWQTGNIWIYGCSGDSLYSYSATGNLVSSVRRPGESADDVDIAFAPEDLMLDNTFIPKGTLLFINGETGTAEIYAIDKNAGTIIDTLNTSFGNSHVVGGAYHPIRNTFFLVQDRVASLNDRNRVAEVNPITGNILQTFATPDNYSVNFGDIDIADATGNILIVSSIEDSIAEVTAGGSFIQSYALPAGVSLLSGIALDCAKREAWVVNTSGNVLRLGGMPCRPSVGIEDTETATRGFALEANYPNPFNPQTMFRYVIPSTLSVHLAVYDVHGRLIRILVNERQTAGIHLAVWNGTDATNEPVASGVYFYRFSAGKFTETRRMVLAK